MSLSYLLAIDVIAERQREARTLAERAWLARATVVGPAPSGGDAVDSGRGPARGSRLAAASLRAVGRRATQLALLAAVAAGRIDGRAG